MRVAKRFPAPWLQLPRKSYIQTLLWACVLKDAVQKMCPLMLSTNSSCRLLQAARGCCKL